MYIVAIAWIFVALMATVTETTVVGAVLTFLFYGLAPLSLFVWIFGTSARRRRRLAQRPLGEGVGEDDGGNAGGNQ
ncbi:MAG: hypothetical protein EKK49_00030 [Rhodocyclaceae bacterium]|nr:MAG: hypothetical protein EKK49_00030 [Rhodocyclaceae bacterium]